MNYGDFIVWSYFGLGALIGMSAIKLIQKYSKKTYTDGYMLAVNDLSQMIGTIMKNTKSENNDDDKIVQVAGSKKSEQSIERSDKKKR